MRTDSKNRRHNLSLSDILFSSSLKIKASDKETVRTNLELQNGISDEVLSKQKEVLSKQKSGLHKSQVIRPNNISKKDVVPLSVQSEFIAQNNKQIEDNKIFKNRVRRAVGLLVQKLEKNQKSLTDLNEEYQRAKMLIKTLEDKNLTQKKALKIYRNELKARDIHIKAIDLQVPTLLKMSKSDI